MSNFNECVALYRYDDQVTDAQLAKLLADALERDVESTLRDHFNGASPQDASLSIVAQTADDDDDADLFPQDAKPMSVEQAAAYLLEQHAKVVTTIEAIGEALVGMNALDDKRAADLAELTEAVEFLGRRVDLRAEECDALGKRIENLTRAINPTPYVRPA